MQNFLRFIQELFLKIYWIEKGEKRYFPSFSMTELSVSVPTNLWSPNPYPHLVICQNIVLEKFVSCPFSPSLHILKTNYISLILKWLGYACFNNRGGWAESRSFKLFEYITFTLHVILLSNTNCTYKEFETAKLRDFFVMSDLSSAK